MSEIRTRDVLKHILLQILRKFPEGLKIHAAYGEIEKNYALPQEWYREIPTTNGYKELESRGISNWRDISQEQLIQMVPTEPQWQNEIRWARNDLRKEGFLDTLAPRGVWKLTNNIGEKAETLSKNLTPEEKKIVTPKKRDHTPHSEKTVTSRHALEHKLSLLTSNMPLADLELLVDIARSIRLRSIV